MIQEMGVFNNGQLDSHFEVEESEIEVDEESHDLDVNII